MERNMEHYSIADARGNLPSIVHEVEDGLPVTLTRRGKPVAMIISIAEYQRLAQGKQDLWEMLERFRSTAYLDDLDIDEAFSSVRDRSSGREVTL